MKKQLLLFGFLMPFFALSQVPSYYNDVNLNLTGISLKDELAVKISSTHTTFLSYTPGVWDALKLSDLDPNDPGKVLLIYGYDDTDVSTTNDRSRDVDSNGGGSTDWNREHVYPKSLGSPNLGTSGPGADAHHLRPSDVGWNSTRSNRKFADGSGNSGPVGSNWYPGDEWKGDVARMMMYMYLRYGNQCLPTGVGVGSTIASDSNMLMLFLEWNVEDPVSDFELQRNPVLEGIQGNRNPFIDNPAFATQIWGGPQAEDRFGGSGGNNDVIAPSIPANLSFSNLTETSVDVSWSASSDNVGVTGYNIYEDGILTAVSVATNTSISGLSPATSYSFTVRAKDAAGNLSGISDQLVVTTNSSGGGSGNGTATELFISEYVEGSSNNKVIEIANFTGTTVDLSSYSLRRNTNGGSSWGASYSLAGSLSNEDVYVVANTSASSQVIAIADITTGSNALLFNGNDPVGLFKDGVLIDIIGVFNGGSGDFAKDVTLRRNQDVTSPVVLYNTNEWSSFPIDTFNDLGTHQISGGGNNSDTEPPSVPVGLSAANLTQTSVDVSWSASTDNVAVTTYEVFQDGSLIASTGNTSVSISNLQSETTYSFTVRALDAEGNTSAQSTALNVTTASVQTDPVTVIHEANFESGWDNWIDGGSDCSRYSGSRSYEGSYSIRLRDNSGASSAMTSETFDLSAFDTVDIEFHFYAYSMENGEDFWLRFNDGSGWSTVETYSRGTDFSNNGFYVATVSLDSNTHNLSASSQFRLQCDASSNSDYIYIDQITITGYVGGLASLFATKKNIEPKQFNSELKFINSLDTSFEGIPLDEFALYPNPVTSNRLNIGYESNKNLTFKIYNQLGAVVKKGDLKMKNIDVNSLSTGIYILELTDGEEIVSKKFIK